ncbi:hypothetical protein QTP86_031007, partial [Hemibagrus guttatus]
MTTNTLFAQQFPSCCNCSVKSPTHPTLLTLIMANFLYLSVHLTLLLSSFPLSTMGTLLPDITDQQFIESCVNEHNHARSNVNPPASNMRYMTWDEGLAVLARKWARGCLFQHNPQRKHPVLPSVGENIWAGTLS